jgi:hypothetical protein
VPLFSDPRASSLIVGGGTNRALRRINLRLDPADGLKALEDKFKKTSFALAQTPDTNVVQILSSGILAEDIVECFARCEPVFDKLAEALKRPHARMDSDYQDPISVPIPNPESLEALAPRYLDRLPHDLITGKQLRYQRTDNGSYMLYSVGWNQTDEGGVIADDSLLKGDWAWSYVPIR